MNCTKILKPFSDPCLFNTVENNYLQRFRHALSDELISQMQSKIQVIRPTDQSIDKLNTCYLER